MNKDETKYIYGENDGATYQTVEGWVSRDGFFCGKGVAGEHSARYRSSTHRECDKCGNLYKTNSYCEVCRDERLESMYKSMPFVEWDGVTPLALFDGDFYFMAPEELEDYLLEHDVNLIDIKLVLCTPDFIKEVSEVSVHEFPEGGELPFTIHSALEELNYKIREHNENGPYHWWLPSNKKPTLDSVRKHVRENS